MRSVADLLFLAPHRGGGGGGGVDIHAAVVLPRAALETPAHAQSPSTARFSKRSTGRLASPQAGSPWRQPGSAQSVCFSPLAHYEHGGFPSPVGAARGGDALQQSYLYLVEFAVEHAAQRVIIEVS